jgi:gamma-glutamylcyclotransferase (GGCT)/AIG2-like uncharacterized protein YtfP
VTEGPPPPEDGPWPLFVYGTLRPGEPLWPVLEPGVVARVAARVAGRLHLHAGGGWPLLEPDPDDGDRAGTVWCQGDLCTVADADVLGAVAAIELGAGYEARWLAVEDLDGRALGPALTFTWPWGPHQRGPAIPGGDWTRRT